MGGPRRHEGPVRGRPRDGPAGVRRIRRRAGGADALLRLRTLPRGGPRQRRPGGRGVRRERGRAGGPRRASLPAESGRVARRADRQGAQGRVLRGHPRQRRALALRPRHAAGRLRRRRGASLRDVRRGARRAELHGRLPVVRRVLRAGHAVVRAACATPSATSALDGAGEHAARDAARQHRRRSCCSGRRTARPSEYVRGLLPSDAGQAERRGRAAACPRCGPASATPCSPTGGWSGGGWRRSSPRRRVAGCPPAADRQQAHRRHGGCMRHVRRQSLRWPPSSARSASSPQSRGSLRRVLGESNGAGGPADGRAHSRPRALARCRPPLWRVPGCAASAAAGCRPIRRPFARRRAGSKRSAAPPPRRPRCASKATGWRTDGLAGRTR